jgi:hypothetical protein
MYRIWATKKQKRRKRMVASDNALAVTEKHELGLMSPHVADSIFLSIERFEFAKKVASMLAASPMVPAHFQGANGVGSCMIALNLAERMRVDPFMLMQNLYVVHGRPGLEGKLTIALINGCGRFEPLEFKFEGQGKTSKNLPRAESCLAFAKDTTKSGKVLEGPTVTWAMAEAEGWTADKGKEYKQTSKWQTMPQLMFMYRAATFFGRVHCPEVLMGLRTKDELDDMVIDVTPQSALRIEGTQETQPGADPYAVKEPEKSESPQETTSPVIEFRKEWIELRTAGYGPYVQKNFRHIEEMAASYPAILYEMKAKWAKLYPGKPWPLVEQVKEPEKAPDTNQEPPPETGDPGPTGEGMKNGEDQGLFPPKETTDDAFFSEVGDYWAVLDDTRIKRILEAFKVKAPADLPPARRRSFLQTCKNQLDQQNAGK